MWMLTKYGLSTKLLPSTSLIVKRRAKTFTYDPFYINLKPSIPVYPTLQICLRGYDFPVLEKFEKYVGSVIRRWTKSVSSFPLAPQKTMYKTYHSNSSKIKYEFELCHYCRVINLESVRSVDIPVIVDLLQQNMPEGVEITIQKHDQKLEDSRYVANLEVEMLQNELNKLTK